MRTLRLFVNNHSCKERGELKEIRKAFWLAKIIDRKGSTMNTSKFTLILLFANIFLIYACSDGKLSVHATSTGNKAEAFGVSTLNFRFSWKLNSKERNTEQIAYQVMIASDRESLNGQNPLWDSGKTESDQSILVDYTGPILKPGKSYFWKVKVWDSHGNESAWSPATRFITALESEADWNKARWIGFEELPDSMRLVEGVTGYGNLSLDKVEKRAVVPQFRKEFTLRNNIESATLFISGLGHYEASINGHKVGDDFLAPGWTHYDKTVLYNIYDITSMLKRGENAIGVMVGNGFFYNNRERYRKLIIAYGFPKMICKLHIQYKNGESETIASDKRWQMKPSPITYSSIYGGEDYDARMEEDGWNLPGFKGLDWQPAQEVKAPKGVLKPEENHPLKVMETFEPVRITQLNDTVFVYDFGQNASGIVSLKIKGNYGNTVQLRPGENLSEEGFVNQRGSGSPYLFQYTLKGEGEETWSPRFTYYGFRYVQVTGAVPDTAKNLNGLPVILALKSLHTRNATPQVGTFECSNELFNRTFNLINWGIKSNIQSVMTDCPTREKLGWLEQTHLVGPSVHYNFCLYNMFHKLIGDMKDAMTNEGLVPSIVPEYINFEYFDQAFRDSPEWGSALLMQPWLMYKWYGDLAVLATTWSQMQGYFSYLEQKSSGFLLSHGLGDWYDVGPQVPGYAQLTPVPLVASAMYYHDAVLMSDIAKIMGKPDDEQHYRLLADNIRKAFNEKFYCTDKKVYGTGSQTSMAMPLSLGIVPEEDVPMVFNKLLQTIQTDSNRITTGDIGFHFLMDVLIKHGAAELLYAINMRDDVPGYGYQLKKGATSLTESWQALETKSMNHMMLGHLMEWFYSGLASIGQTDYSVAYREVLIAPQLVGDLNHVSASFESPYGEIVSDWKNQDGVFYLQATIPVNSVGIIKLPYEKGQSVFESGKPIAERKEIVIEKEADDHISLMVGSGKYSLEVR